MDEANKKSVGRRDSDQPALGVTQVPAPTKDAILGEVLITDAELAEALGSTANAICKGRSTGELDIPFVKIGRRVRYRVSDVLAYLERNTHGKRA